MERNQQTRPRKKEITVEGFPKNIFKRVKPLIEECFQDRGCSSSDLLGLGVRFGFEHVSLESVQETCQNVIEM